MSWSEIKNQKNAVQMLRRSLEKGRLAHAYLFVADPVDEAERLARELAKAVNCETKTYDACNRCTACKKIEAGFQELLNLYHAEKGTAQTRPPVDYGRKYPLRGKDVLKN